MQTELHDIALSRSVLRTLLYFDLFNYPLNAEEVFHFLGINSATRDDVEDVLQRLTHQNILNSHRQFYGFQNSEKQVQRRLKGNNEAEKMLPLAHRQAQLIYRFPFVRAVMGSGSLSKNYMDENSDLDFFIITAHNRLWIARMILVLYKRIVLRGSFKHFCVNYFVDENHLDIDEKNQFTATELATLLPLYDATYYKKLIEVNRSWLMRFFPNYKQRDTSRLADSTKGLFLKRVLETLLNIAAVPMEKAFMVITLKRWKRIYSKDYREEDFNVAFKTNRFVSKNHPRHYQRRIMERYDDKLRDFSEKLNIELRA